MRRLTFRKVDIIAGVMIAALGGFVLMQSLQLDFYVEGVPGPGFFPALLAIAMSISGALLVLTRLRGRDEEAEEFRLPSRWQARRSLGLWITVLGSSLLVGVVGFLAAMFLLVAVILLGIEGRRGIWMIVTIIATPLLAYLLFASLLQVPLPAGVFGS